MNSKNEILNIVNIYKDYDQFLHEDLNLQLVGYNDIGGKDYIIRDISKSQIESLLKDEQFAWTPDSVPAILSKYVEVTPKSNKYLPIVFYTQIFNHGGEILGINSNLLIIDSIGQVTRSIHNSFSELHSIAVTDDSRFIAFKKGAVLDESGNRMEGLEAAVFVIYDLDNNKSYEIKSRSEHGFSSDVVLIPPHLFLVIDNTNNNMDEIFYICDPKSQRVYSLLETRQHMKDNALNSYDENGFRFENIKTSEMINLQYKSDFEKSKIIWK